MVKRIKFLFLALLIIALSSCGSDSEQLDDAALSTDSVPLSQNVPLADDESGISTSSENPIAMFPAIPSPIPDDQAPALTFNISGGIIGFCDELTINDSGEYVLQILCEQNEVSGRLNQPDLILLETWHKNLRDFQITFEDNPGGPDNLITNLIFKGQGETEADDLQRQAIFDWAGGLVARLRPQQAEPTPTPGAVVDTFEGLCPEIGRPALLTIDVNSPDLLFVIDPDNHSSCQLTLSRLPFGRIATAGNNIYYPFLDAQTEVVSILAIVNGEERPLAFTEIAMTQPSPFDFVVSNDGSKIAWTQTMINRETDPPIYANSLWVANIDGSNQIALLDQVENDEIRFVTPIRFSTDSNRLYFALQPDIGGLAFSGRYDNLYSIAVNGGEAQLHYACPSSENPICITGFSLDETVLTVIQLSEELIQVVDIEGDLINTIPLPATDYVERTAFGINGSLAFVSATLLDTDDDQPPRPEPGYISFLAPPYTGEAQILLSNDSVGTIWRWLDETRLAFGSLDQAGNINTSLITMDGQVSELSPHVAVGVLR